MPSLPSKLKLARRQTVQVVPGDMVHKRPLVDGLDLPLLIEPVIGGIDLPLWLETHCTELTESLRYHGAILFRGFGLHGDDGFQRALAGTGVRLMPYIEKATPREHLSNNVYTSTFFPQEYPIAQHNELSYVKTWPGRIFFYCDQPSLTGGETPLADVRRVLDHIRPEIQEKFQRLGWQLVRTFGSGMGPTWQHAFDVETVGELETYLSAMDISWEWLPNGWLRTRQTRPAIHRHPVTGEALWFNHIAFWHMSSLPEEVRSRFAADFGTENLPYSTCYGDGTPIPDDVAAELRRAYDLETIKFPWKRGDFLMIDNMLISHGRSPFTGARRILAGMGDGINLDPATVAALDLVAS
jgi:alpha-ketoglutarate-dependent taurine dioxygenase